MKAILPRLIVASIFAAAIIAWLGLMYCNTDYRTKFIVRYLASKNPIAENIFRSRLMENYSYFLGTAAPSGLLSPFIDLLNDPDPQVRTASLESLQYLNNKQLPSVDGAEDTLDKLVAEPDPRTAATAIQLLDNFHDQHNADFLKAVINNTKLNSSVRAFAITIFSDVGGHRALDEVIACTRQTDPAIRARAIRALAYHEDAEALEVIAFYLSSSDEGTCVDAADAVQAYRYRKEYESAPAIFQPLLMKDVRNSASALTHRLNMAELLSPPAEMVADELILMFPSPPDPHAGFDQYKSLQGNVKSWKLSRESTKNLPILKQTLQDPTLDPEIRKATEKAITDLGG